MKICFNPSFDGNQKKVIDFIHQYESAGALFVKGSRNSIKTITIDGVVLSVKSFKVPHLVNSIAYRYFRKSKARRSFENALTLLNMGIGTPEPVAYFENSTIFGLKESYYVCAHLQPDFTFRELVHQPELPNHEIILREFTRFCWELHRNGIEFKDHSPGNTLILKTDDSYQFFLVDLNRMVFHKQMPFDLRMKNLSRLTPKKEMVMIMSDAYAQCSGEDPDKIFKTLWHYTQSFQQRFHNKKKWKKRIGIAKR